MSNLRRHYSGRFQVIVSPEQRPGQRHKLSLSLKEKERKSRKKAP
jgi:hypothetical protein